ncbi:helix-turn-helix domain-containing protein [Paucisalibacillus globulus]|uniref:helix-turn-helix domain-containing protein n=1 Tax=Paucisalibacillus globulus TaxID=351095 RepID=UPI000416E94C|nr:RodZ domain-containing protein [Paucisalibacillus globulus]
MGIGARLKEARVEQDISLDALQDTTKIQKRYLVAIEEENFSVLPGKFYAKAFIKEYAIAVGLDPNQLMEDFKEDIPSPEEDTTTQYTRIHRSRKDNMPTKSTAVFSFIPTVIVAILIIGILFLAWWFIIKSNEAEDPASPADQTEDKEFYRNDNADNNADTDDTESNSETEDTSENESTEDETGNETEEESTEEEPELGITVLEQGTGTKPTSELELSNVGEALNIEFVATGQQVWLDVQNADGESFFSGMVSPDEPLSIDLKEEKRIYLNVGHAPSLTITINGVELEYPVDPNQRGADHQRMYLNVVETNE